MGRECSKNGEKRNAYRRLGKSQKERDYYENHDVGECIILWHVDPLLSNDRELSSYTTVVAK
jgi:hypothetical protein